jgi:hypothetical protein
VAGFFDRAMKLMRKHDPQTQEDGFALLEPVASEFVTELIAAFEVETDNGLKYWLLELIASAGSEEAFPVLAQELTSADEAFRNRAASGLTALNSKAARTLLWEHGHPA